MMKNPAVKMSLLMGITMSFVLSLIGNLSSGMFTVPGFLKSFCISFLISLIIGFIIPIKKISDDQLIGQSPAITRHFIELRGIGIVDVKSLFGVESVMLTQNIDMVIRLEDWNRETNYDRLGLEEDYIEFLGNKVVCYSIPIRPGRNLAVIVESAAINFRAKKMGYNAARELYNRVSGSVQKKAEK